MMEEKPREIHTKKKVIGPSGKKMRTEGEKKYWRRLGEVWQRPEGFSGRWEGRYGADNHPQAPSEGLEHLGQRKGMKSSRNGMDF